MRFTTHKTDQCSTEITFLKKRIAVILGIAAIALISFLYAPYVNHGPILCPLHAILGLPCPACGLTRAFCALIHGNITAALAFNALSIPVAAFLIIAFMVSIYEIFKRRHTKLHAVMFNLRVAWAWAIIVITYHLTRVIHGLYSGWLANEYLKTSWTYHLIKSIIIRSF